MGIATDMEIAALLADGFERIRADLGPAVRGLDEQQLAHQIGGRGNSIAWLAWHLSRVQDSHIAEASGGEQVWTRDEWQSRFGLPLEPGDTGYGHTPEQVGAIVAPAELLLGYHDAVCEQTLRFVRGLSAAELDDVVDESWNPPVTLGVRLVSVLADDLQHVGQAAYVRGLAAFTQP
jgi:uncharacterized damage-inducible protein DinB